MILQTLAFYLFAAILLVSAVVVISARNPVHSVLCLILAFFNAAALFVLVGAEFLAMILVIVYVGAVAVLFLFVVMMLDIDFTELRTGFLQYMPVGGLVGLVLLAELVLVLGTWAAAPGAAPAPAAAAGAGAGNANAIGEVLYTEHVFLFQAAGLVLLVAMVGAIVLTLRSRPGVRRQRVDDQVSRRRGEAVEINTVEPGSGV